MRKRLIAAVVAGLGVSSMLSTPSASVEQPTAAVPAQVTPVSNKKITVVAIPGFSFVELEHLEHRGNRDQPQALPHLAGIKGRAAWGALNIRTPGKGVEDVYATLGAGNFAESGAAMQGLQAEERFAGEPVRQRFERFTAQSAPVGGILIPDMESVKRANTSNHYLAQPGLLGQLLSAYGVGVSVWGNADLLKSGSYLAGADWTRSYRRYGPLMLADQAGRVPNGDVSGKSLLQDASGPFGWRTDYSWLLDRWKEQTGPAAVLLELGDLQRLYDERASYSDAVFDQAKRVILTEMDRFIGELVGFIDAHRHAGQHELWLLSPQVNPDAVKQKSYLAPIMKYIPAGREGLLTSATTRRAGIVSVVDIAPTLLESFGVRKPQEMIGLPVHADNLPGGLQELLQDVRHMQSVYALRPPLLYGLAAYEITVMLASLAAVWMIRARSKKRAGRFVWRTLLFSLLLAPAGLLIMGWLPAQPAWAMAAISLFFVLAACGGLAAAAVVVPKSRGQGFVYCLAGIGLLVSVLILYDGLHGAQAMKWSVLGCDPMIGARYYGIGNEFMGVLLGAALLGLTALQQAQRLWRRPRRAAGGEADLPAAYGATAPPPSRAALPAAAAGVLVAGYLAAPALGTNAGGALAAAAGFGALTARLAGVRRWLRAAPAFALLMCAALAGLWLLNSGAAAGAMADDRQSHVGRAFEALRQGRLAAIGAMIERKLEMNRHLIGVSAWSKVLLTGLAVMAALVLRPRGRFRRWQRRYPYLMYGCAANVIGTIAALLLNDSGIVAAATMVIYGSVPLLLLKLEGA